MASTDANITGTYAYTALQTVQYGPGRVKVLPQLMDRFLAKKAMILTGNSLKNKTDVISNVEKLLGSKHALTFSEIGQHAPVEGVYKALDAFKDAGADIIISIGGGSPIDSAKAISHFHNEKYGSYIKSIAIPTTLSAAEYTPMAGFTKDGKKTGVRGPELVPAAVILDGELSRSTPEKLWLGTGMRALDHAVESLYRPYAPPPVRTLAYAAIADLFKYLRDCKKNPKNIEVRQRLLIAAWQSLFPYKQEQDATSALGVSHALGYMLGSPYSIPHGECSCLTLGPVVQFKAKHGSEQDKQNLAKILSLIGLNESGNLEKDVKLVGAEIDKLVCDIGLDVKLSQYKVPESDLEKIVEGAGLKEGQDKTDMIAILRTSKL